MMRPKEQSASTTKTQRGKGWTLELLVSADRPSARVRLTKAHHGATCSVDDVIAFVRSAGPVLAKEDEEQLCARSARRV